MKVYNNITEVYGNTPLVKLNKLRKTKRKAAPAVDRKEVTGEVSTTDGQGLTQLSDGQSR